MYFLHIALLVVGLVALVVGYRKNSRNILLASALTLFAACALPGAINAFVDGYQAERERR